LVHILQLENINKQFPGVHALKNVNLAVKTGTIHAIIGENGAGKSTLVKIISGVYGPTSGSIYIHRALQAFNSPFEAQGVGISTLYQEYTLLPELSVAENIFLGSEPQQPGLPSIDWKSIHQNTLQILHRIEANFAPEDKLGNLTIAQQQLVQIAKAMKQQAELIVLDEPTARLSPHETQELFKVIKSLKNDGVSFIYITHRLEEVHQICDLVTIMRDGRVVATLDVKEVSTQKMASLMLGKQFDEQFPRRRRRLGKEVLRVQGLTHYGAFEEVDFALHRGEILGITGLVGSGGTALLNTIFGMEVLDEGQIYVDHKLVHLQSPREAVANGIGLLTEDRREKGLIPDMGVPENINLSLLEKEPPGGLISHEDEAQLAAYYVSRLNINVPYPGFKSRHLSGGTQQKVIISKWMATRPHILLCDEPTQGLDIGAKTETYALMNDLVSEGMGIVMVSRDVTEVFNMCDRVLVLRQGRVVGTLDCAETTVDTIWQYMSGELKDGS
jgi:ABC-type sugar transport system ATPase subunit